MPEKQDASAGNYSVAASIPSIRTDLWKRLVLPVVGVALAMFSWQKWQDWIVDCKQLANRTNNLIPFMAGMTASFEGKGFGK